MGSLWPKSGLIEHDNNDDRAVGAKLYIYDAGTSTPKTTYQDSGESTIHPFPVVTDGNGRWPAVYIPFGSYKEVRTTSADAAIGATIDNIPNVAPFDSSVVTDPLLLYSTGHVSVGLGNEVRSGFVRLNGRTIGNAASSATERANADASDLFVHIWDRLSDTLAPVSGGRGGSGAADFAANKRITLPDARAAGLRGFDDMGNTAAALLGSAPVIAGSTILPGSTLGSNTQTLTTANLASHTHTGTTNAGTAHSHTGTTSTETGNHTHDYGGITGTVSQGHTHGSVVTGGTTNVFSAGGLTGLNALTTGSSGAQSQDHTHTYSGTSATQVGTHTHTFTTATEATHTHTFTSDASGSGTAHNNVARDLLVTFYIKL